MYPNNDIKMVKNKLYQALQHTLSSYITIKAFGDIDF